VSDTQSEQQKRVHFIALILSYSLYLFCYDVSEGYEKDIVISSI